MKYGIYYAYWEKQWGADYLKYVKKVKDQGFDIFSGTAEAQYSLYGMESDR